MLYDPKWQNKTTTDPFNLSGLIAWLERQPPAQCYSYHSRWGGCLLDQYISSITKKPSGPLELHYDICGSHANYFYIAKMKPRTMGDALIRAKRVVSGA